MWVPSFLRQVCQYWVVSANMSRQDCQCCVVSAILFTAAVSLSSSDCVIADTREFFLFDPRKWVICMFRSVRDFDCKLYSQNSRRDWNKKTHLIFIQMKHRASLSLSGTSISHSFWFCPLFLSLSVSLFIYLSLFYLWFCFYFILFLCFFSLISFSVFLSLSLSLSLTLIFISHFLSHLSLSFTYFYVPLCVFFLLFTSAFYLGSFSLFLVLNNYLCLVILFLYLSTSLFSALIYLPQSLFQSIKFLITFFCILVFSIQFQSRRYRWLPYIIHSLTFMYPSCINTHIHNSHFHTHVFHTLNADVRMCVCTRSQWHANKKHKKIFSKSIMYHTPAMAWHLLGLSRPLLHYFSYSLRAGFKPTTFKIKIFAVLFANFKPTTDSFFFSVIIFSQINDK